jgi:hypothetical protein
LNEQAQTFFGYSAEELWCRDVVGAIGPETDSLGLDLAFMIRVISSPRAQWIPHEAAQFG